MRNTSPAAHTIRFRRWSRKAYAAFASIGRCVTIGCLRKSVADSSLSKQKKTGTAGHAGCGEESAREGKTKGMETDIGIPPGSSAALASILTEAGTSLHILFETQVISSHANTWERESYTLRQERTSREQKNTKENKEYKIQVGNKGIQERQEGTKNTRETKENKEYKIQVENKGIQERQEGTKNTRETKENKKYKIQVENKRIQEIQERTEDTRGTKRIRTDKKNERYGLPGVVQQNEKLHRSGNPYLLFLYLLTHSQTDTSLHTNHIVTYIFRKSIPFDYKPKFDYKPNLNKPNRYRRLMKTERIIRLYLKPQKI